MFRANNAGGILAILVPKATARAITPKTRENDFATAFWRFATRLRLSMLERLRENI